MPDSGDSNINYNEFIYDKIITVAEALREEEITENIRIRSDTVNIIATLSSTVNAVLLYYQLINMLTFVLTIVLLSPIIIVVSGYKTIVLFVFHTKSCE